MARTPAEIHKEIETRYADVIDALEKEIDEALVTSFNGKELRHEPKQEVAIQVIEAVKRRFEQAGWDFLWQVNRDKFTIIVKPRVSTSIPQWQGSYFPWATPDQPNWYFTKPGNPLGGGK